MEGISHQNNKSVNSENMNLGVLNESLAGKTEAELTPEEKEAEEKFCKENFKKFLDWINDDEIFVHSVTASNSRYAKGIIRSIFEKGILSAKQLEDSTIADHGWDRPYQASGGRKARQRINSFLELHKRFEEGVIDGREYESEKNKIIETAPKIGRARVAHFLNKVIPRIIGEVGYPVLPVGVYNNRTHKVEGHASNSLGIRNTLTSKYIHTNPEDLPENYKNIETWDSLPSVMSGKDLISSSSSGYMKEKFSKLEKFFTSELSVGNIQIFFKAPHELRQYEQGAANSKETGGDIGISNRIPPSSFRAIRFGIYDNESRVLNLNKGKGVAFDDMLQISELQEKGLILIDNTLVPIPPLKSIRVTETDINFRNFSLSAHHSISPLSHPVINSEEIENVRNEIKEGKIDTSLEEFEESLKNNHLLNVMLSNQQKALGMIEEMGGVKNNDNNSG